MSQHAEQSPHSRSAIIADLACVIGEVAVLQERQAALNTTAAAIQGRLAEMVRSLSQGTSISTQSRLTEADVRRMDELLKKPSGASADEAIPAARMTPMNVRVNAATPAASPPGTSPSARDEARPVQVGKGSDAKPEGVSGGDTTGQSEQFVTQAGAGGASVASADTAPAADAKPKRTFQQPLVTRVSDEMVAKIDKEAAKPSAQLDLPVEPVVPRREPASVPLKTLGGGRVQGGPVPKGPYIDGTIINLVIARYHSHVESAGEIDKALGIEPGTSRIVIDEARMQRDERVMEADRARSAKLTRETTPRKATLVEHAPRKPAPSPAAPPASKPEAPGERAATGADDPVIIIDTKGARIIGPAGEWKKVTHVVCKSLQPLTRGELLGIDRMMKAGGWTRDTQVLQCLPNWTLQLRKIGVDLVHTKGIGVKLNRLVAA